MNLNKTIIKYLSASLAVFLFARIYTLFGHGVTSFWMSNAFLFLLGLGALVFSLLKIISPHAVQYKGYWQSCQIYNSGIAILVNGMLLKGILEIAGGTSGTIFWFFVIGIGLMTIGVSLFVKVVVSREVLQEVVGGR